MIFFDSAATTFQKPRAVQLAVLESMRSAASVGRGGYPAAQRAAEIVFRCREVAAGLFDAESAEQVVLTANATHGLNIAIRSLAQRGGRAVISCYEHNAVTRTLAALPQVEIDIARGALFKPEELISSFEKKLSGASFAVCTHVSNVFGYILPIEEIAALCRREGVPLVIDAAQSAGCLPLSMKKLGATYLAMAGHKGLYGAQGTGLLLCAPEAEPLPLLTGGTGSGSLEQTMPSFLPDRLEAGTHNVAGIAGLTAGMEFVKAMGVSAIAKHEQGLRAYLSRGLERSAGDRIRQYETPIEGLQSGVLSFVPIGKDVEGYGAWLAKRGFCVRTGLHCAPLAHQSVGTADSGTVRVSFSALNRREEVRALLRVMSEQ